MMWSSFLVILGILVVIGLVLFCDGIYENKRYQKLIKDYNTITFKTYITMKSIAPTKWSVSGAVYGWDTPESYTVRYEENYRTSYQFKFATIIDVYKWQRYNSHEQTIKTENEKVAEMQEVLVAWQKDIDTYYTKAEADFEKASTKSIEIINQILED